MLLKEIMNSNTIVAEKYNLRVGSIQDCKRTVTDHTPKN